MKRMPVTVRGLALLEAELKKLKTVERPAVIRAISQAREYGDLSENAEYHAAKERQGYIEGRVIELEDKIARAEVIDPASLSGQDVKFGATVRLEEVESGDLKTFRIVGEDESDVREGLLSITAPLAASMIGKRVGDQIEVAAPGGGKSYEIVDVHYT